MENQEAQTTITIDDKDYAIADLSASSKYCLQQIEDIRGQLSVARARLDQLAMSESGFITVLKEEVVKVQEEPTSPLQS